MKNFNDKKKKISSFLAAAFLLTSCVTAEKLPVMKGYQIFDVDVEELSGLCLNKDKTALLSAFATEVAGMCYDPVDDRLWIVDSNEAELYLVTVDGKLNSIYSLGKIENAESVCLDRERGCIWVGSDEYSPKLYRYEISF